MIKESKRREKADKLQNRKIQVKYKQIQEPKTLI